MSEQIIQANPLRGHVVSFPKAIPSRTWLADRMLWADHLGAVWPASMPRARSDEDELAFQHLSAYNSAGFFTERRVHVEDSLEFERDLEQALASADHDAWLQKSSTTSFTGILPTPGRVADDRLFYMDKFPENIKEMLLRTGIAKVAEPTGMLKVTSNAKARVLMNALVNYAEPWGSAAQDLPLTLDAEDDDALAQAAAPGEDGPQRPAVSVPVPVIEGEWGDIAPQRLIDFRANDANERARQDYLNEVARRLEQATNSAACTADDAASRMIGRDLELATRSLGERVGALGIAGLVFSTVGTLAPISLSDAPPELLGAGAAVAGLGLTAYTTLRPSPAHGYLRRARKAGLRRRG
jgi:hypothetical protein